MVDYAVNDCHWDADEAFEKFANSIIGADFGKGFPAYVLGMSGIDVFRKVCQREGIEENSPYSVPMNYSPEYWAGWAIAYYQWQQNIPFATIIKTLPISKVIKAYNPLHEEDISQFVKWADRFCCKKAEVLA